MTNQPQPESDSPLDFEEALEQLDAIVRRLEEGKTGLNVALEDYERGIKLLRQCHQMLEKAERRIEVLSGLDADGNPVCQPWDDTALSLDEKARSRSRRRSATDPSAPFRGEGGADPSAVDESGGTS